jgi:hypothetical protein
MAIACLLVGELGETMAATGRSGFGNRTPDAT